MTSRQELLELLQTLPEHRLREVIDFVKSIQEKEDWSRFGLQQLSRAYGDDEPDYEIDALRCTWADELEALFNEWRAACEARGERFVADGAIGADNEWATASPRVLFLLKEPHDRKDVVDGCSRDLRELFRNPKQYDGNRKTVEKNCGRWAFGIHCMTRGEPAAYAVACRDYYEALLQSAVVNIKKTPGQAATDDKALYIAAEKDREFLMRELKILRPQVIVCGNTMWVMRRVLQYLPRGGQGFWHRRTLWIDHWHPAARRSPEKSYERLLACYQERLQCRPNGWPSPAAASPHTAEDEK